MSTVACDLAEPELLARVCGGIDALRKQFLGVVALEARPRTRWAEDQMVPRGGIEPPTLRFSVMSTLTC
jgi:hypothetical protein